MSQCCPYESWPLIAETVSNIISAVTFIAKEKHFSNNFIMLPSLYYFLAFMHSEYRAYPKNTLKARQ